MADRGRRAVVGALCAGLLAAQLVAIGCSGDDDGRREVVLYSSVDRYVLDEAIAAIEAQTDLEILLVTDTEATKTFGLVERLTTESERPRADVWWSSEPFGTVALAQRGVLAPGIRGVVSSDWPRSAIDPDGVYASLGARARVVAYDPARTPAPPQSLAGLTDPAWNGRVAMADPRFGTTRGHIAALVAIWGEEAFERWLTAMHENGLRVFDSNSTVVRELRLGTVDLALTDSDDVWASLAADASDAAGADGARPRVEFVVVGSSIEARPEGVPADHRAGPVVFPNTVALVADSPNPDAAAELARRIVSPEMERLLALSDSRNAPLHPATAAEFPALAVPGAVRLDFADAARSEAAALRIAERVLGL